MEHSDHNAEDAIPDFDSAAVQTQLSPSALRIFRKMAEIWAITYKDTLQLLGSRGERLLLCDPESVQLDRDTLMRILYLTGIFKALNFLHSERLADQWIRLPNTNIIFRGQTPMRFMIDGGLPAMQIVRRLLDARPCRELNS